MTRLLTNVEESVSPPRSCCSKGSPSPLGSKASDAQRAKSRARHFSVPLPLGIPFVAVLKGSRTEPATQRFHRPLLKSSESARAVEPEGIRTSDDSTNGSGLAVALIERGRNRTSEQGRDRSRSDARARCIRARDDPSRVEGGREVGTSNHDRFRCRCGIRRCGCGGAGGRWLGRLGSGTGRGRWRGGAVRAAGATEGDAAALDDAGGGEESCGRPGHEHRA